MCMKYPNLGHLLGLLLSTSLVRHVFAFGMGYGIGQMLGYFPINLPHYLIGQRRWWGLQELS